MIAVSRQEASARDRKDPLAGLRDRFEPDSLDPVTGDARPIYLDGNSLGPLPRGVRDRLAYVAGRQWGVDLISSWNKNGWMDLPLAIGNRIGRLIGAAPGQVAVGDSTSVNLFKTLSAALQHKPERRVVVSERGNFPTDLYVAENLLAGIGGTLRLMDDAETDLVGALAGGDVAVVMLTQVDYRTGRKLNMAAVTAAVQAAGATMLWDLAHSAGAFAVDLDGAGADFAVGCGYKFLNGGPGAPAFLYVADRHQATAGPLLAGWLGHRRPFDFVPEFEAADGISRFLVGTPPVLSMSALDAALDVFDGVDPGAIETKAASLTDLFIDLVDGFAADHGLVLASPRRAARRGAQVSYRHPHGYPLMQALIARGVTGDFRAPDIVRFGFAPSYLRHVDVWDAADRFRAVLEEGAWRDPALAVRAAVT